jgi:ankyrin repeat protein
MVLLLMENGADINHKTPYGYTALSMATSRNRREIVDVLTKAGAKE